MERELFEEIYLLKYFFTISFSKILLKNLNIKKII